MKKFEIGKTYFMRSACDHNCIWKYTVVSRTEKSIIITDGKKTIRRLIIEDISVWRGAESCFHLGTYSMAPVLSADREWNA